ncbi:hypothetical protein AJ85_20600 [Alkalihalobacillus alcalophilus ATCC 27647 = CGMCC 1.3604]|uniref:Uncharacterized protein n=1 Tax=Alkalihalobacillus alcalophilus ATCC 27647 = CGMCC 1.3604 TaxID=1218173 RepID=A0A4S4JUW8_ALKAL|nr:hypothetical protein AJ85_20600 [Alkalihalobacillus alcalophilus ATCC 27647 = CGMCC 1.3604]
MLLKQEPFCYEGARIVLTHKEMNWLEGVEDK